MNSEQDLRNCMDEILYWVLKQINNEGKRPVNDHSIDTCGQESMGV